MLLNDYDGCDEGGDESNDPTPDRYPVHLVPSPMNVPVGIAESAIGSPTSSPG